MTDEPESKRPKRFLVYGFFGGWNSGDEAIMESVVAMLRERFESPEIAVLCTRVRPEYAQHYNALGLNVVSVRSWREAMKLIATYQLIIGGGQMITGDQKLKGLLLLWAICRRARTTGRPAHLIGIGVEGVHRRLVKWICRRIVNQSVQVGCRDEYSLAMLRDAGCDDRKLSLKADVVFGRALGNLRSSPQSQDRVAPVAIGLHASPIRQYANLETYLKIINGIREADSDRKIVLVSNDARNQFDAALLNELQAKVKDPRVAFQHFESVRQTIETYANAHCVISVRMHPLILALIHGTPAIGIRRSNKVLSLANRVGFELVDPEDMTSSQWLRQIENAKSPNLLQLDELQQLAQSHFDSMDSDSSPS